MIYFGYDERLVLKGW